ncbi:MAG TPA: efflux RND transporter periplasmic adaptor subunit [Methylomirabilota bacterium]|nr:efflux RND transporter periplasmic adaptor subunit [Methylomirabilota bacterium]
MLSLGVTRQFPRALERGLAAIALLAVAAGCDSGGVKEAKETTPAPPTATVIVTEVSQRDVQVSGDFVARTEAVPTVDIRARVAGVLEEVRFREGSAVKQGQVLFVIQQDEYRAALQSARAQQAKAQADLTRARDVSIVDRSRAQLDRAKADLGKARQDVARYRPLVQEQAIPQQDLDTALSAEQVAVAAVEAAEAALRDTALQQRTAIQLAEAAVESAKAAVTQAELNLGYTVIESPISGIISKLAVDRGNLVGKGEATSLATVSAIDPMYVDFSVPEADYLRLVKRLPALGRGELIPDRQQLPTLQLLLADGTTFPHKGRPVWIDRAIDPKTGTIQVRAQFPNPEKVLRASQFGRVRAVVEERRGAILVPQVAVQDLQGAKTVLVVGEGDKVALRTVTLAEPYQDFYIVTAGLKPGERVIVEGIQKARPGMQVKAELRAAAAAKPEPAKARAPATTPPAASPATKPKS